MLGNLFGKIMGFIVIVVTLALAPSIITANAGVTGHASIANMTGLSVVAAFGPPLITIGLLVAGGAFAVAGIRGGMQANAKDLLTVVAGVIVVIVGITFMATIVTYTDALIAASPASGIGRVIYAIIPLILYLGIMIGAGWAQVSTYRRLRGGRRSRAASGY